MSKIIPVIKRARFFLIVLTMQIAVLVTMIMYDAEIALYRAAREVFIDRTYDGLYLTDYDLYVCVDWFSCEHERGHSYDAHGAPDTSIYSQWRSTREQFRADIDTTYACMTTILTNYDILHTEYPKISQSLMAIESRASYYSDNEDQKYREIYAELYAIMKTYRWDIYHYDDVEDMTAQKVIDCQRFLDENAETLRPRQN